MAMLISARAIFSIFHHTSAKYFIHDQLVYTDGCTLAFNLCVSIKKELERHLATNLTSRSHNKKEQFKKFTQWMHFHLIKGERMSCR